MAISSTQVLSIAAPIDIVHLGRSMLIGISAHRTALQEIPTGTLCPRNDITDGAVERRHPARPRQAGCHCFVK